MTAKTLLFPAAVAAVLLAAALPPAPDSWGPFEDQRVVSPSGRRYVVVKKAGGGIAFELCERAAGAPPMTAASTDTEAFPPKVVSVDRDPADRLVVAGTWHQQPLGVQVPDTLDGFLLFEKYARVGHGKSVAWIDGKGTETVGLKLTEIFGAVPKAAWFSVSSIWWYEGYWIDEAKRSVVVVAAGDEVREIALADGSVTTPDAARLVGCATAGTTAGRAFAFELLSRTPAASIKLAVPTAMTVFHDEREPLALRLRAAVLLTKAGSPVACEPVFAAARDEAQPADVRCYAARQLPTVLGDKALPILRELMRGPASGVWGDCYQAFASLGEAAVPTLIEMLREKGESADYRGGAAHALGVIKSALAFEALLEATATADAYTANAACNAAIATGGEQLGARLIAMLAKGSTQDGRIACWLQEHPTKDALPAIEAALQRATDQTERQWLEEARAACRR